MSLRKPGEADVVPSGAPLGAQVSKSVDSILSAKKPKNWSAQFRDFIVHYVGPETDDLTVGTKLTVITQNSEYTFVVTDNGLKAENGKIKDREFDMFNEHYCLIQTMGTAGTSSVRAIMIADKE